MNKSFYAYGFVHRISEHLLDVYSFAWICIVYGIRSALIHTAVNVGVVFALRTAGMPVVWNLFRIIGLKTSAALGLVAFIAGWIGLSLTRGEDVWLIASAVAYGIGSVVYHGSYHVGLFTVLGSSGAAVGRSVATYVISKIGGLILAVLFIFVLEYIGHIALLPYVVIAFLCVSIFLVSRLPLTYEIGPWPGYRVIRQSISRNCHLGNFIITSSLLYHSVALLAIVQTSDTSSGLLTALGVSLAYIVGSKVGGYLTDSGMWSKYNTVFYITAMLPIAAMPAVDAVYYPFCVFLFKVLTQPWSIARDAYTSLCVKKSGAPVAAVTSFEMTRGCGDIVGATLMILIYVYAPSPIMWVSGLTIMSFFFTAYLYVRNEQ